MCNYYLLSTNGNKESAIIDAKSCIENVDDQLKWKENCELDNQLFWNGGSIYSAIWSWYR